MDHLAYLEVKAEGKQHAGKPWLSRCVHDGVPRRPRPWSRLDCLKPKPQR